MSSTSEPRIVLMVSTYAKVARFVPLVRQTLEEMWPEHPPLRFLTDGGIDGADVIVGREREFVPLMAEGLARIREEFPAATHVFHMLEDHCPLRCCDHVRVEATMSAALEHTLAAVAFVTYDWPWDLSHGELQRTGAIYGLSKFDVESFSGESIAAVPRTFFRYFQLQPTIWKIDYLIDVLTSAKAQEVTDPWNFEAISYAHAGQHYVSRYRWPTVHNGFMAQGRVNDKAIAFADRQVAGPLRHALIREAVGVDSEGLYKLQLTQARARRLIGRVRRRLTMAIGDA